MAVAASGSLNLFDSPASFLSLGRRRGLRFSFSPLI
jgi:hypothetical protein